MAARTPDRDPFSRRDPIGLHLPQLGPDELRFLCGERVRARAVWLRWRGGQGWQRNNL